MSYTVKYKLRGQWFWRKVKNVIGDTLVDGRQILILQDDSQIHLPLSSIVVFDKDRHYDIQKKINSKVTQ